MNTKKPVEKATSKKLASANFSYKHYVPLLKPKGGELWAIENTTSLQRQTLTPVFEVHTSDNLLLADHVAKVMRNISRAWETNPCFIDTQLFGKSGNAAVAAASSIFAAAGVEGLNFIPVTSLDRSNAYQSTVAANSLRGVMVRLCPDDFFDPTILGSQMAALAGQLGIAASSIDVLIDYGAVASHASQVQWIRAHVNALPNLMSWRTITVAGGSFPASLAARPPHQWHSIPREEWTAWQIAVTSTPALRRLPSYGDYGVRDTQPPAQFGSPYANIRYTSGGLFLVRRHDVLFRQGGSDGIYPICESLVERPEFRGASYSAGDESISTTAEEQLSPGNPGSWTQWGMSHHFAIVVDEIQSLLAA
jgi:hypothetical protein